MKPGKPPADQDGKSQTASAVDPDSYPEHHEDGSAEEEMRVDDKDRGKRSGRSEKREKKEGGKAEPDSRPHAREDLRKNREENGSVQR